MAKFILKNPAFGNVPAQSIQMDIPEEGQIFRTGETSPLQIVKGGQIYTLSPESILGTRQQKTAQGLMETSANWTGANTGEEWQNYFSAAASKLGTDINKIPLYHLGDVLTAYKALGKNPTATDLATFKSYIQAGGVAPTEMGSLAGAVNPNPTVTAAATQTGTGWIDPATGRETSVGIGVPAPITLTANQPPAGATYIDDPAKLKSLTESQIWRDPNSQRIYKLQQATLISPAGQKKVVNVGSTEANNLLKSGWSLSGGGGGAVITADILKNEDELKIGEGTTSNSYLADSALAGIDVDLKSTQDAIAQYQKLLEAPETDLSKQVQQLLSETSTAAGTLTGKGVAQLAAEQQAGINQQQQIIADKITELNKKVAEVNALTASYQLANQQEEGRPQTLSRLQGAQGANYRNYLAQKNLLVSEASYLQADLLGAQNKLEAAQNAVNRAVELEYADREASYNVKLAQLNILIPQLEKEEKNYATAVQMALEQQANALAEAKQAKKDIQGVKLQAISAGITDASVLNQIGNAISYDVALQILGTSLPKTTISTSKISTGLTGDGGKIIGKTIPQQNIITDIEQLSPLAKAVYNGTIKLTDITPTQRAEIAPELDSIGYSASISGEVKQDISTIISGMDNVVDSWQKIPDRYKGKIQGRITSFLKLEENVPEVSNFKAASSIIGMQLTRLFEKGRISDQDRIFYLSLMPNLNQNEKSAIAGAEKLKELLSTKMTSLIRETSGGQNNNDPMGLGI